MTWTNFADRTAFFAHGGLFFHCALDGIDRALECAYVQALASPTHLTTVGSSTMALKFLGKDPASDVDDCPSVWVDESDGSIVIQGREVEDPETRVLMTARNPVAEGERVVRIPFRMAPLLLEACRDADPRRSQ
ncbi:hypothetical protein [Spongiactinospora sp. TRM90649]|uniref:hypothetical protein n=1 Tax=Spongiactinospora sp. TRM90649 TaxID=3031114 RepID=UPI0023F751C6|nr:hypothetical protein [Spongiactinospora sp. TRM90649]MDF5755695.1 hypothetical protein [Spongiactinospora sp. TRM90649]